MNICVYGASSSEVDNIYITATEELGEKMALRGHALVFGGGANGMMGAAARGVYRQGGQIIGIAPSFFNVDGVLFENCTEFYYPETMRERKKMLEDKSDAFVISPGGIGTLDEFFEILTLKQLGRHKKPIAVFNVNGHFDDLKSMLEGLAHKKFMSKECLELCPFFSDADSLLDFIENYKSQDIDILKLKHLETDSNN